MLELADIRYVGSGVLASAASMDKHYMKVLLAGAGLPVGPYLVVSPRDWERRADEVRRTSRSSATRSSSSPRGPARASASAR